MDDALALDEQRGALELLVLASLHIHLRSTFRERVWRAGVDLAVARRAVGACSEKRPERAAALS